MNGIILEGVQPDKRFRASLILGAVFILLLIAQGFDLIPRALDRLPTHSESSSIDNVGYGEHYEAVTVDHLITRWAKERRALLGLD